MHEVSIMQNTLDLVIAQAQKNSGTRIDCLTLKVGQLSGVMPEALEFAFEILVQGTMAENAQLEIEIVPVICDCLHCRRQFQPETYVYQCPSCHQISSEILQGRELDLVSMLIS